MILPKEIKWDKPGGKITSEESVVSSSGSINAWISSSSRLWLSTESRDPAEAERRLEVSSGERDNISVPRRLKKNKENNINLNA